MVRIPGSPSCMLKCPWARYWTLTLLLIGTLHGSHQNHCRCRNARPVTTNHVWMLSVLQLPSCLCCSSGWMYPTSFYGVMTVAANAALSHWPQAEVQRWGAGETDSILSQLNTHTLSFFFLSSDPNDVDSSDITWDTLSHLVQLPLGVQFFFLYNCFSHMQYAVNKVWLKIFSIRSHILLQCSRPTSSEQFCCILFYFTTNYGAF